MSASNCVVAPIENLHRNLLRSVGATLRELSPIGALIEGFDLAGEIPSEEILQAPGVDVFTKNILRRQLKGGRFTIAYRHLTCCEYGRPTIYLELLGIGFTPSPSSIASN